MIHRHLSEFVIQRRKILLWSITALMLGLVICIPNNELNDNYLEYFDESIQFRQSTDFIIRRKGISCRHSRTRWQHSHCWRGACALGETVAEAQANAYAITEQINWDGVYYRTDIGYRALAR